MAKISAVVGPVKLNRATMKALLNGDMGMDAVLRGDAEKVLDRALAIAAGHVKTGRYRDSLHIETFHTDRLVYHVVSDAPHAYLVERNLGVLTRALAASLSQGGRTRGKKYKMVKAGR